MRRASVLARIGVGVLSASTILLEISLTRLLSFATWYHFTYLILSLALLGLGAAASTISSRRQPDTAVFLRPWASAGLYALTTLAALLLVARGGLVPDLAVPQSVIPLLKLLGLEVVLALPFYFAGLCLTTLIVLAPQETSRRYAIDLVGAGVGAVLSVVLINSEGAAAATVAAAALGAIAALCVSPPRLVERGAAALLSATFVIAAATQWAPKLQTAPSKEIGGIDGDTDTAGWNIVSRIDISRRESLPGAGFGGIVSTRAQTTPVDVRLVYQDGAAPAAIVRTEGAPENTVLLGEYLQGAPYQLVVPDRALIVGIGGGIDGLIAMHHGARTIVGVDVNPITVGAIRGRYRDELAPLWHEPGRFRAEVSEGRHFLTRPGDAFDVIQMSGVDTFAALASGAYALSENYLYTLEGQRDAWHRLSQHGVLSVSRWLFDPPRETLRLVCTELAMLERDGVADPARHIAIIAGGGTADDPRAGWGDVIVSRDPLDRTSMTRLKLWADERGFRLLYDPFTSADNIFDTFIRATPTARSAAIAAFPYRIDPATDDRPFFFDFYRWSVLARTSADDRSRLTGTGGYAPTRRPLTPFLLIGSFLQVALLGAIGILTPLRRRHHNLSTQTGPVFVYFAAIGLAFMCVEIALMQLFSVFLGGPGPSLAISLSTLLISTGAGAALVPHVARRASSRSSNALWLTAGTIAALILEWGFARIGLPSLLSYSTSARQVIGAAAIAPVGLVLGQFLPLGLAQIATDDAAARAWAWAINAFASVLGSVTAVILATVIGFSGVLAVAGFLYGVAGLALKKYEPRTQQSEARRTT